MGIKDRIDKLGVYFDSMNLSSENGIIYIRVKFPKGWGCSELTEYNYNILSIGTWFFQVLFYFFVRFRYSLGAYLTHVSKVILQYTLVKR